MGGMSQMMSESIVSMKQINDELPAEKSKLVVCRLSLDA